MQLSLLTLNLHTYQQHPRHCCFDTMHQHEREVHIIAEAIAHLGMDVVCFQEVGEYLHDPITQPYGESPSNMAFRICQKLRGWGHWYNIHQDWSHIGFHRWREGTAIMSRYPMRHNYSAYVSDDWRKDNYMSRNVTVSCIDVPWFGLLHVANAHLSWAHHGFFQEYSRLKQLVDSRRYFGVRADLMVGDFNVPAGEHAYNHIVGTGEYIDQFYELHPQRFYQPSYHGRIDGWKHSPPKRIDYIFKRNGHPLRIKSMDIIFNDEFYPVVSDHFGYFAKFDLF
ncbi:endonuclease/exonuclease/phosphatase family protein [Methylomonas sp. 11b]|uniref:endonuclease/exonuclease/phosphatase family protein n=1 Tax=Methylomonas sp. 11b TaxID=1168169 RepID=UPI0004796CED|nr:endonuclease/exonuclease/phosphatase family protein [Methylomonas sp. 11b]